MAALFSLDDVKNNDLIFVGSPAENLTLLEIPGTQEFVFRRVNSGPRKGDLGVVNVHPQPGESTSYWPVPQPAERRTMRSSAWPLDWIRSAPC